MENEDEDRVRRNLKPRRQSYEYLSYSYNTVYRKVTSPRVMVTEYWLLKPCRDPWASIGPTPRSPSHLGGQFSHRQGCEAGLCIRLDLGALVGTRILFPKQITAEPTVWSLRSPGTPGKSGHCGTTKFLPGG